jgi:putative SOS response-associated peptidase YedK
MCNLYSITKNQEALRRLFRVDASRDLLGNQPPMPGVFPAFDAPVVRSAADGAAELVRLNWGFVLLQDGKAAKRVTNARWDNLRHSGFWQGSFEERRCLVPATSFAEPTATRPAEWVWFARPPEGGDVRPLFAFAGIWRRWRGRLKIRGEMVEDPQVYAIVTVPPNEVVRPIHRQAMPVVLTTDAQREQWIAGSPAEAYALARPAPAESLVVVYRGEKEDVA